MEDIVKRKSDSKKLYNGMRHCYDVLLIHLALENLLLQANVQMETECEIQSC